MGDIPERIRSEARKAIYDTGRGMIGRERNYLEYRVSKALYEAEKRGREEERERCAVICEHYAQQWDNGHDDGKPNDGFNACMDSAAAIRSGQ